MVLVAGQRGFVIFFVAVGWDFIDWGCPASAGSSCSQPAAARVGRRAAFVQPWAVALANPIALSLPRPTSRRGGKLCDLRGWCARSQAVWRDGLSFP